MENQLKRTGIFLAAAMAAGILVNAVKWIVRGDPAQILSSRNNAIMAVLLVLFLLGAYRRAFAWVQPTLLLLMAPISLVDRYDTFYGLGFYVLGMLFLFRLGFFERHRVLKLVCLLGYLFAVEIYAGVKAGRDLVYAFTPVFYLAVFLLLLYLAMKDRLVVFLREPKERLSLQAKGLAEAERIYVLAAIGGKSAKEIAVDFELAESTIRNTLARAYRKLEVEDKAGLAALAEKYEIVA